MLLFILTFINRKTNKLYNFGTTFYIHIISCNIHKSFGDSNKFSYYILYIINEYFRKLYTVDIDLNIKPTNIYINFTNVATCTTIFIPK